MKLDITFSLYDTEKRLMEYEGCKYKMPQHVTIDVYNQVMRLWKLQRMSADRYAFFEGLRGKKTGLIFMFVKNTIQVEEEYLTADVVFLMPFLIAEQEVICRQKMVFYKSRLG